MYPSSDKQRGIVMETAALQFETDSMGMCNVRYPEQHSTCFSDLRRILQHHYLSGGVLSRVWCQCDRFNYNSRRLHWFHLWRVDGWSSAEGFWNTCENWTRHCSAGNYNGINYLYTPPPPRPSLSLLPPVSKEGKLPHVQYTAGQFQTLLNDISIEFSMWKKKKYNSIKWLKEN